MMKKETARILIVEDDMIIAANISLQLTQLGYEVTGIESRGEEAVQHAMTNAPDLLLLDVNLKGKMNGFDTARAIQNFKDIPIIYLTANNDEASFALAKETRPWAFITKPFNKLNLQRTIALVVAQISENKGSGHLSDQMEVIYDRIFVRHNGNMEKILLRDILYVEADRNYSKIVTESDCYLLTSTLKSLEEKLPNSKFVRVHRSFLVNLSKLDVVAEHHIQIKRKVIPMSKSHKERLLGRIQTI